MNLTNFEPIYISDPYNEVLKIYSNISKEFYLYFLNNNLFEEVYKCNYTQINYEFKYKIRNLKYSEYIFKDNIDKLILSIETFKSFQTNEIKLIGDTKFRNYTVEHQLKNILYDFKFNDEFNISSKNEIEEYTLRHKQIKYFIFKIKHNITLDKYELCIEFTNEIEFDVKLIDDMCNIIISDCANLLNSFKEIFFDFTKVPGVGLLSNQILQTLKINECYYLDKQDGVRFILLFTNKKVYRYSASTLLELTDIKYDSNDFYIVDSEYLKDKNEYKVFEVYVSKGVDIRLKPFIERINSFDLKIESKDTPKVSINNFKPINDFKELLKYALTPREGTDGIIIQLPEPMKDFNRIYTYKLKPIHLNTIDFLVKKYNSSYRLYLYGNPKKFIVENPKMRPKRDKPTQEIFNYDIHKLDFNKKYNILFDSSLIENLFYYIPVKGDLEIKDDDIVEMSYQPRGINSWKPIRIRSDKVNPNSYIVGLSTVEILFSPIVAEPKYFKKVVETDDTIKYHNISHIFRQFSIEHLKLNYISKFIQNEHIKLLDFMGGRGANLKYFYSIGIDTIFATDFDREAIIKYHQKVLKLNSTRQFNKPLLKIPIIKPGNIIFNGIGADSNDLDSLLLELNKREEFKEHTIDIVFCGYAIHYISGENRDFKKLNDFLKSVLTRNGLFIVMFHNGDELKKIKEINVEFKVNENKKNWKGEPIKYATGKMKLPTINGNDEEIENIVFEKYFEELEDFNIIGSFSPINDNIIKSEVDNAGVFLNYIETTKVVILQLKNKV